MAKTDDPLAQRVHRENAEWMLLTNFVSGLTGTPWRQVGYANPKTLAKALKIAFSIQKAARGAIQRKFYTEPDESVRLFFRPHSPARSGSRSQRPGARAVNHTRSRQRGNQDSVGRSANRSTRNAHAHSRAVMSVKVFGHRQGPPWQIKGRETIRFAGKRGPHERPRRPRSPRSKTPYANKWETRKAATGTGNGDNA